MHLRYSLILVMNLSENSSTETQCCLQIYRWIYSGWRGVTHVAETLSFLFFFPFPYHPQARWDHFTIPPSSFHIIYFLHSIAESIRKKRRKGKHTDYCFWFRLEVSYLFLCWGISAPARAALRFVHRDRLRSFSNLWSSLFFVLLKLQEKKVWGSKPYFNQRNGILLLNRFYRRIFEPFLSFFEKNLVNISSKFIVSYHVLLMENGTFLKT